MNLNNIREGELKEVFDTLEEAFVSNQVNFYLIGALAKDVWYSMGDKVMRTTRDVDFAVMISNKADYEEVRKYLVDKKGFQYQKSNDFILVSPSGVEIDILPFGAVDINEDIKVNGFMEVYKSGTTELTLQTGHHFNIATLPSIVLLKLIAFDDRPENRFKDPRDIINIIFHFFDLQAELIYNQHSDLFAGDEISLEKISATVIGREIKKTIEENEELYSRVKTILKIHLEKKEASAFIRAMVEEADSNVENIMELIIALSNGLNEG